jgi:hypothetical protein
MEVEHPMGYESKVQVIRRGGKNRQYYLICPAPLAGALELEKGELIQWVVKDRYCLEVRRQHRPGRLARRRDHE